ncbi:hypothetical protein B0H16DRAFT_1558289 [Mycena metata]|uniref:J domain-containing protein n=1 Tax=Mycena metata TaxID=1033252 RepID=A0AAD7INB4_9AGAR|nr:hypothetical protein B0H16DRAFT_1893021 [Mycena metata]KAJ7745780.1 hypothetical protein B0H16DRAFT_1558289 [Mycena metata]
MGADYYKLLGIEKSATEAEIKSAYKKMALKWHPDRNGGSEESSKKFKQISEAFEVLSDGDKRAVYDQFGEEGLKGGGVPPGGAPGGFSKGFSGKFPGGTSSFSFSTGPGGGFSASDPNTIFEHIFGGGGLGGSSFSFGNGGGGRAGGRRGRSNMFDQDVDMDSPFGMPMGGMPGGMGGMPGMGMGGGGMPRRRMSPKAAPPSAPTEITRPLKLSLNELFSGTTKRLKVGRKLLDGTSEDKVLEIQVQPGWKSGTKVRFPHAGNEQLDGEAQDLVFVVEEKPHDVFQRDGNDLMCRVPIPLLDALTDVGGKKIVEALDGRKLQITVPPGVVKPGQQTTVSGEGMPIRKDGNVKRKGDLIVKWDVVFPDRITSAQKEGLKKVLG